MKKLLILLSLLPACLVPGRAQEVREFASGTEYVEYVTALQLRRAEMTNTQDETMARRRARVEELRKQAAAETDPQKRRLLEDQAAGESRMIGEAGSRYLDETYRIDRELEALQARYEFIFPEAFPYYRDREQYTKEELKGFLQKSSREIRRSWPGRQLKKYIRTLP